MHFLNGNQGKDLVNPADSTYIIPIILKYSVLGIYYIIYVRYLYGFTILEAKNFPAYLNN